MQTFSSVMVLFTPVQPDSTRYTHSHRRHHDTSYLCLPPWKESNHIHTANKLKNMTQHAHPNIYTAIQLFKDIQNSIEIANIQRAVGDTIRPRAKKYLNIDRRLATLKDRYQTGVIDLITYADSASQLLHLGWFCAWFLCRSLDVIIL